MSHQLIILQGGEDIKKRVNDPLIKKVGNISSTKKILIIPWTTESIEEEIEYRNIIADYFLDNGFIEVLFIERNDSSLDITRKISPVDVIYLPGGDPDVLYREIKIRDLHNKLRNFKGIIIGNSAGAIVLSKGCQYEGKFYQGFGLIFLLQYTLHLM
ncbi:MAG: Type 1 glutamine amidotransferase-like domain-containing protein [Thermoplasmataceae archaeon]